MHKYFLLLWIMAEREELLDSGSAGTVGVVVSGGKAEVVVMGVGAKAK